jgi:hypothetical protein
MQRALPRGLCEVWNLEGVEPALGAERRLDTED